jgi:hypothetical protein
MVDQEVAARTRIPRETVRNLRRGVTPSARTRAKLIRKFSSHGAGTWTPPKGYVSPVDVPAPHRDVYELGGERWLYDLWYDAVRQVESGSTAVDVRNPGLDVPAIHQVTISTAALMRTYNRLDGLRPFSFMSALPALRGIAKLQGMAVEGERPATATGVVDGRLVFGSDESNALVDFNNVHFYAPYGRSIDEIRGKIRRSDNNELVKPNLRHMTVAEAMEDYFSHPEW